MRALLRWLIFLLGWGAMVLVLIGFLAHASQVADTVAQFRLVLAAGLVVLLPLMLVSRQWLTAAAVMTVLAATVLLTRPFLPWHAETTTQAVVPPEERLRVVQFNLRYDNTRLPAAIKLLQGANADVLLLQEVKRGTLPVLEALRARFPHQVRCDIPHRLTTAILSRTPFIEGSQECVLREGISRGVVTHRGSPVELVSLHLPWPWPYLQARYIERMAPRLGRLGPDVVLAGDFNAAPWSGAVARVAHSGGLTIAPGLLLSWAPLVPGLGDAPVSLLPIDHLLTKGRIRILARRALGKAGSDHHAILTVIALAGAPADP